jgi:hypothetical protein
MPIICWGNLAKSADDTERIEQSIQGYVEGHDENPNAHMGADYSLGAHRLQTMLDHPYDSIKYYHVYDIHAEKITAGGMVIKGDGPYISVQDGVGTERVKIYPEGIIVKEGKISVENEGNQEIIDGKGLRGSNIFYSGQKIKTTDTRMFGDNMEYPLPPLEFGVYFSRATPVLVFGVVNWRTDGDAAQPQLQVQYPTGYFPTKGGWFGSTPLAGINHGAISFNHILSLYTGYSLVRLIGSRSTPDSNIWFEGANNVSTFGYVVLGN